MLTGGGNIPIRRDCQRCISEVLRFGALTKRRMIQSAYADVAQLVEHLICNQGVGGSSPSISIVHWAFWRGT